MNNQLRRELKIAKIWYYNFRYSIYFPVVIPSSAIGICLLMILLFVVPQVQNWVSLQDEIHATQARIETLKSNISYLQSLNTEILNTDFNTAIAALPADKDFVGILDAIANSAITSKVAVQDFSFTPASAATQKVTVVKGADNNDVSVNGMTPIQISLVVQGAVDNVNNFIKGIEKRLPLAEIKEADFNQGKAQVLISFYTRSFPKVRLENDQTVNVLSDKDKALLKKLRSQNSLK